MNKFYFFSKKSCGPCNLVQKYFDTINFDTSIIETIDLEEVSDTTVLRENLNLSKRYGIYVTPVLVVVKSDDPDCVIEEQVGGTNITMNIRRLIEKYG